MMSGRPTDLIQSVSRALRILEEVGDSPQGLNAKQIAHRCEIALPTTYHLVRTLAYEGYLVRRDNGVYALGMEIASRFRDLVASLRRPPQVHDVLRQLAEVTGHTAYFAQLVDGHVLLTDLVEGPHSPHLEDLVVGFDEGAHATALGKALLSTIPVGQRKALLEEQGLRPFTSNTITDEGQLHHEIARSARSGIFTEEQQYRPEVCCAAILVGSDRQGAIGMSGGSERWAQLSRALVAQLATRAGDLNGAGAIELA
jgi:DNA-binding IclR family transcriptional regulator